jgi:flagellar assembly factor FliW
MLTTETHPELATTGASSDQIITFPSGLVGCESWRRFVLQTEHDEELPVAVLECLDEAETRLLVTDPRVVVGQYSVPLSEADRSVLGLDADAEPVVYCTLTLAQDGWLTANLLGPLAINPHTRIAKQLVLADSGYSTRHPIAQLGANPES